MLIIIAQQAIGEKLMTVVEECEPEPLKIDPQSKQTIEEDFPVIKLKGREAMTIKALCGQCFSYEFELSCWINIELI